MAEDGDSLESWLNKATNPANREEDWEYIIGFCDQVNKELEGPQIATKLIAHKIQSPQDNEAMQALTVLEACVKNCGRRFHQELGKFRFLNELIKLVSPKYLGEKTTERVKTRVIELIFSWSIGLPHETKIGDAYQMLKKQGIVKTDPTYLDKTYEAPPPPRPKNTLFEDDDKAKLLDRLLKSKNPEDLQAANRLIKNMVKEDSNRMEKVSRRLTELETCNNNVKLLNEMLLHYTPGVTSDAELDLMKELYEACERMRPKLFTLASDVDDKDDELNDVLQANDALVRVMDNYKSTVGLEQGSSASTTESSNGANGGAAAAAAASTTASQQAPQSASAALLEDQLSALGFDDNKTSQQPQSNYSSVLNDLLSGPQQNSVATTVPVQSQQPFQLQQHQQPTAQPFTAFPTQQQNFGAFGAGVMRPPMGGVGMTTGVIGGPVPSHGFSNTIGARPMGSSSPLATSSKPPPPTTTNTDPKPSPFDDLDVLSKSMIEQVQKPTKQTKQSVTVQQTTKSQSSLKPNEASSNQPTVQKPSTQPVQQPLVDTTTQPASQPVISTSQTLPGSPVPGSGPSTPSKEVLSLADVFVPLESVQPGGHAPITTYDKNNVRTVFHFAKDSPRPDVLVVVVSTMSSNPSPVKNVIFQAAVPKVMKVKLQPPSASELPAFNPILPPAAITQIMLLANPNKEKVRLKYKLSYSLNEQTVTEVGEVDSFPRLS
ncbi:ADP-ribosylation factor-binding protein GGA1-like [Glandiceps talaboti]